MKSHIQILPAVLIAGAMVLLAFALIIAQTQADVTTKQSSIPGEFKTYTFFSTSTAQTVFATTTTATSTGITGWFNSNGELDNGYFVIAGARKTTLYFTRGDKLGGGNTGKTHFRVQVTEKASPSESDWRYYADFLNATSSSPTVMDEVTIYAATSTATVDMDSGAFYAVRCIAVETTDGSHECKASAAW